jgi:hypothetical protein
MNWQSRIFTATLAFISLIGEISNFSPAAADARATFGQ